MKTRTLCYCLAALFLASCESEPESRPASSAATDVLQGRRECPKIWDPGPVLTLPGNIRDVPEFHDCQRFIVQDSGGNLQYDSLFAIFASFELASLEETLLKFHFGEVALAAAEIYTTGQYPQLGINEQISCVFVWLSGKSTAQRFPYRARMVPRKDVPNEDCREHVHPDSLPGQDLQVIRTEAVGFSSPDDYPAVARWDWDAANYEQYLGIRCGAAWCEVGRQGFTPSQTYLDRLPNPGAVPEGIRRIYAIKGWYDEQLLATVRPRASAVPTPILGTVFPDSMLGKYTLAHFTAGPASSRGARVAHVALEVPPGEDNPYQRKFGWHPTQPGGALNTIDLCHGNAGYCNVPSTVGGCGDEMWWARAHGTSGGPKHICVTRYDMPGVTIPGTARWRWLATDEGNWFRCVDGCCEMTQPG